MSDPANTPASIEAVPPLLDLSKIPNPVLKVLYPVLGPLLNRALKINDINELEAAVARTATPETFFSRTLELLGTKYEVSASDLDRIPEKGPVVVVANHPLGGLDGIILGDLLKKRRPDTKLMANYLLKNVHHADHHMIFVDPFPKASPAANIKPLRECLKHLKNGGLLAVFPGNRVSHYQSDRKEICDPQWVPHIASLIRRSGASAVPLYIDAANSKFFSYVGLIHPLLRTLFLSREFIKRGKSPEPVKIHVGTMIPSTRLKRFETDEDMISFLRVGTYMLSNRPQCTPPEVRADSPPKPVAQPIAAPLPPEQLEADIRALPPEAKLIDQGDFEVYMARYQQLPHIMQEIGRGREEAFRSAGGGTLAALDLSPQDEYYHHLFVWSRKDRVIVGAYRIGLADEIIAAHGTKGLISSGLFNFKPEFVAKLNPGLELGRSYIIPKYQRNYSSLLLLWGGIIAFIARNPKYNITFGSVGVSQGDEYSPASRTLIIDYLRNQHSEPTLAVQVESQSPFTGVKLRGISKEEISSTVTSVEDVSALITGLEEDGKGMPILIRHYTRMNGKLLEFGVWKNHSNAVVGFLVTDVTTADPKLIRRYMGEELFAAFRRYHGLPESTTAEPAPEDRAEAA